MTNHPTISVRPDLVWQEIDEQVVLLDPATSTYHGISGAGTTLWPLVTSGTDRSELVEELVRVYEIDPERADRDVEEFLNQLAPFLNP